MLKEVTKSYRGLQGVRIGYNGLQWFTWGYRGLKGGYSLQAVKRDYKRLLGVTRG